MKRAVPIVAAFLAAGVAASANAQMKPEDYAAYRKGVMQGQRQNLTPLAGMAQGRVPYNKDEAVAKAQRLETLIALQLDGFVAGSEGASNTRALPAAFTDSAKLQQANKAAVAEAGNLVKAAQAGSADALKPAVSALVKQCDSCHDSFRGK